MLHIILFVLKIFGWILLIILGLLVLVFLLVLFTPLRYQVQTRCKGKLTAIEAGVRFHLFFHLVSGTLRYEEKKLIWDIRAAWIKLGNSGDAEENKEIEETDVQKFDSIEEKENVTSPADEATDHTDKKIEESNIEESNIEEIAQTAEKETQDATDDISDTAEKPLEEAAAEDEPEELPDKDIDAADGNESASVEHREKIKSSSEENENNRRDSWSAKIASVFKKIKYTFSRICDKIKALSKKAEEITAFLEDRTHQAAFWKLLAELKRLLLRMRPKQIDGDLEFGFDDPSLTGRVLAGLSMLYPYWELRLYPDFEHKVLDGSISVKGSVRLWPAAAMAWNLIWNRDVRRTVLDIKKIIFK